MYKVYKYSTSNKMYTIRQNFNQSVPYTILHDQTWRHYILHNISCNNV